MVDMGFYWTCYCFKFLVCGSFLAGFAVANMAFVGLFNCCDFVY